MLNNANLFLSVTQSLARLVTDFAEAEMPGSQVINWDDHANINELPEQDVIGLAGIGLAEDEPKKYSITLGIMISTWNDPGLHRLTTAISKLFGQIAPGTRITVYTLSDNGLAADEASWMVTTLPRAALPITKAEVRAIQAVECQLLLDPGATSSLR